MLAVRSVIADGRILSVSKLLNAFSLPPVTVIPFKAEIGSTELSNLAFRPSLVSSGNCDFIKARAPET